MWDKCASLQRATHNRTRYSDSHHFHSVHRVGTYSHRRWRELSPLGTTSLPLAYQTLSASCAHAAQHRGARQDRASPRHEMLGELNATLTILPDSVRFGEEKFTCSGAQAGERGGKVREKVQRESALARFHHAPR